MENKALSILAKIANAISMILIVGVIIFASVFTVPKLFGIVPYVVLSGSMEPEIQTGSVAFINTKDKDPEIGDVITFTFGDDKLATHRVVDIVEGQYVTKGDANEIEDGNPVTKDKIVGTYLFNIPKIGFVMGEITPKHYLVAGIWIIIVNVIAAALKNAASPEKQEEKE